MRSARPAQRHGWRAGSSGDCPGSAFTRSPRRHCSCLGATALRAAIPNISGFLALALPLAMSVGREMGLNPLVCALIVMITGDAVLYYPVQSASALVIYERGHVSAGEILRFGLWMTAVAYAAILFVALPYWSLLGETLAMPAAGR